MKTQSITQISLKANEELVKRTKLKSRKGFWMIGKETYRNLAEKGQKPDWQYEGLDFINVFVTLTKREQNTVKFLKDNIRYNTDLGVFNFIIPVSPTMDAFLLDGAMSYNVFLKGFQGLYKRDLARRVSTNHYMLNPEFFIPSGEQALFQMKWDEAKRHPDAPEYKHNSDMKQVESADYSKLDDVF